MELIRVNKDLIKETSIFARDVFIDYFKDLIGIDQAEYMVSLFLSKEAIERLIDEGALFNIVRQDKTILGFNEYQIDDDRLFLSKLYVHKDYRGKGIGKILFENCIEYAINNNLNKIYLTVNKGNTLAYNIYIHLGFKVIDSVIKDIGNGYVMDDYIMEYDIKTKKVN